MEKWASNDLFIMEQLIENDALFDDILESNRKSNFPDYEVSATQGKFLYLLAKIKGAKRILEIGTFVGYSTIWLAKALPNDGALISLEFETEFADMARKNIERAGFSDKVQVIQGAAADSLNALIAQKTEPLDMIFIDADKPSYPIYLELSLKLSKSGTVIYADNIVRNGELCNKNNPDEKVIGVRQFVEKLGKSANIESTALQTVGLKGYDGFTISIVH